MKNCVFFLNPNMCKARNTFLFFLRQIHYNCRKKGVVVCKISIKEGTNDGQSISTDIWKCSPWGNIQAPLTLPPTPTPDIPGLSRMKNIWNIDTHQVSYNPKSTTTTTTTKSQKKSCLLLNSKFKMNYEAFNSHFGLLLRVTHQIVTLWISVISAFSVFSDFNLLYLPQKVSYM